MGVKTIQDIANLVGCSSGTVSRAINNRPGINAETRKRILQVMDEVGYRPNAIAQSLASQQTHTIALIVPDITEGLQCSIAMAADKELFEHKYNIMLCNTYWDTEIEREKLLFAMEKRVDGIILRPVSDQENFFQQTGVPTVLVSHGHKGAVSYIDIEHEAAGAMAAEHLLACGYRRIAFIGGMQEALVYQRLAGFRRVLEENGRALPQEYLWFGDYSLKNGYQAMAQLLALPEPPDAVFCCSDNSAMGAYQKAAECQLDVPNALGIVGFNNDLYTALPQINLTTIAQPTQKIGALAAKMVLEIIENGKDAAPQKMLLYPELVVRGTTRQRA